MYLEVRQAVLEINCPHLDLETLNGMLRIALDFNFCDVAIDLGDQNTKLLLRFKETRTSIFVEQWVIFWMRPFDVEYTLDFDNPLNGMQLAASCFLSV